ncbi:MAG: hypothetical protein M1827_005549 [Pycnora praestabilis]|nr:MAG: hypothetical protein M1827_005549 [Pycnora praestabilis]
MPIFGDPQRYDCDVAWRLVPTGFSPPYANDRTYEWISLPEAQYPSLPEALVIRTPIVFQYESCKIAIVNTEGPGDGLTDKAAWFDFEVAGQSIYQNCIEKGSGGMQKAGEQNYLAMYFYASTSFFDETFTLWCTCSAAAAINAHPVGSPMTLTCPQLPKGPPIPEIKTIDELIPNTLRSGGDYAHTEACNSAEDCEEGDECNYRWMQIGVALIMWGTREVTNEGKIGWCELDRGL